MPQFPLLSPLPTVVLEPIFRGVTVRSLGLLFWTGPHLGQLASLLSTRDRRE
jgi:hypothetical protein